MSTHTPGPWRMADSEPDGDGATQHVHATVHGTVYCIAGINKGEEAGESGWLANARLIAAAPDLLDCLKKAADTFDELARTLTLLSLPVAGASALVAAQASRKVIAKAEGE